MKETRPNIVLIHMAVGIWDTFSEKSLLELCNKAENLCNLWNLSLMQKTNINEADIKHFGEKII